MATGYTVNDTVSLHRQASFYLTGEFKCGSDVPAFYCCLRLPTPGRCSAVNHLVLSEEGRHLQGLLDLPQSAQVRLLCRNTHITYIFRNLLMGMV